MVFITSRTTSREIPFLSSDQLTLKHSGRLAQCTGEQRGVWTDYAGEEGRKDSSLAELVKIRIVPNLRYKNLYLRAILLTSKQ